MISQITLNWPSVIEFGPGKISTLREHLEDCKRIFILIDQPLINKKLNLFIKNLKTEQNEVLLSSEVIPEPPIESLENLLTPIKSFGPDAVVGIGGGSTMDLAKLVAVLFSSEQKVSDIIGTDNVKSRNCKLITVSSTSGTGSEVTPIAILTDTQQKLKKGVVSKYIIPDIAIVDPELTLSVPPSITASTGMDAMTHCIEAYTNIHSHPIIDTIALEGIRLIATHIETAVKSGNDREARTAMALGSLYGGLCLGPVNTAAVHALAYPLGGEFKIPHGTSNSVLLPFVMRFNLEKCTEKYAKIADAISLNVNDSKNEKAKNCILKIREISEKCGIPSGLKDLSIKKSSISSMAQAAYKVTRLLDNNPRPLTISDIESIYLKAYSGSIDL